MKHRTLWLLLITCSATASARVWQVPAEIAKIDDAIEAAADGDTVEVAVGTYFEWGISGRGKAITLTGSNAEDPTVVRNTVVDGAGNGSILQFTDGEGSATRVEGLTFAHGRGMGAGIYCEDASPTIRSCLFLANSAKGQTWNYAGGVYCRGGSAQIEGCWFIGNRADWGGGMRIAEGATAQVRACLFRDNQVLFDGAGIDVFEAEPVIEDCLFDANRAGYGGAIYWAKSPVGRIARCQFLGNSANWGGAVYISVSAPQIVNSLFVDNDAKWGGAVHAFSSSPALRYCTFTGNHARDAGGAIYVWGNGSEVTVTGTILWGDEPREIRTRLGNHVTCTYSDIDGGRAGEGNLAVDPLLIDHAGILRLLAPGSACIDAGPPGESDALPWPDFYPNGSAADMGAYGGPEAQLPGRRAFSPQPLELPRSIP